MGLGMGPRLGMGLRLALESVLMARQQLVEALSTAQRPNLVAGALGRRGDVLS